jgi:hypothetical protein
MMRTVLIAGVAGLAVIFACEDNPEPANTATSADVDAQSVMAVPLTVVEPVPIVDSAAIRAEQRARARRDSIRAAARRDSVKRVVDRAIANRRRY